MAERREKNPLNQIEILHQDLSEIIDKKKSEIRETETLLSQSQIELDKLTKKNASITSELQKLQFHTESFSRSELRAAYESALEAQQRLFLMRGKVDKVQSDLARLNEQLHTLVDLNNKIHEALTAIEQARGGFNPGEGIEMIIQAQEAERQRLSRQMHDGPAQALSNFILQTEIAMRLFEVDPNKAKEELESLRASATQAFQKVRDFIFELRPMMLDDLGLVPTIKKYVDAVQNIPGVNIQLSIIGMERRLESYLEVMIFRAIQELLGNAIRHSQASQVKVLLELGDTSAKVTIDDNGKGFDPEVIEKRNNMGLKVIRDRVEMLGGDFYIDTNVGKGTRISFTLPLVEQEHLT